MPNICVETIHLVRLRFKVNLADILGQEEGRGVPQEQCFSLRDSASMCYYSFIFQNMSGKDLVKIVFFSQTPY